MKKWKRRVKEEKGAKKININNSREEKERERKKKVYKS